MSGRIGPFGPRSTADDVVGQLDLRGRTAVITGANTGIGYETARALASAGARSILACRDAARGEQALRRLRQRHPAARTELGALDLASFRSIRSFAEQLEADAIEILVCNAGLYDPLYHETAEGFERTVGVCHIGHFLLATLLLPRLQRAGAARVVVVASESHRYPRRLDFDNLPQSRRRYSGVVAYGQAKLCNILFAKELQRRCAERGVTAYALHPGTLVPTGIGRNSLLARLVLRLVRPFTKSLAQGAAASVFCAAWPGLEQHGGGYFRDCRLHDASAQAEDPEAARRLWALSEQWVARTATDL